MKPNLPLVCSVLCLTAGLALIVGYGQGTSSINVGYPIAASALQFSITTTGPAVVGGVCMTVLGLLLMIWALICAIIDGFGFARPDRYSLGTPDVVERQPRQKWFEKHG
jgi:hypothetical protein